MIMNSPEYKRVHKQIVRKRGRAAEQSCADCGNPARDWAHVHDSDPLDVNNYEPRCRSCHNIYDEVSKRLGLNMIGNERGRLSSGNRTNHPRKVTA